MKNLRKLLAVSIIIATFAACDKNLENGIYTDIQTSETITELYAPTEYNLNMRDFALAINEAVNTNKSFRKLIKEEALKMFDGDYDVLLSHVLDKQISQNDTELSANAPNRVKMNYTVRDLLEDSYFTLAEQEKISEKTMMAVEANFRSIGSGMQRSNALMLLDALSAQYPDLQVSIPIHVEQLEDANYIPPVAFIPEEHYNGLKITELPAFKRDTCIIIDAVRPPEYAVIVVGLCQRIYFKNEEVPPAPTGLTKEKTTTGILLTWSAAQTANTDNTHGYFVYRKGAEEDDFKIVAVNNGWNNVSFQDRNGLIPGYSYSYYVMAYNEVGNSTISNTVSEVAPFPSTAATPLTFNVEQFTKNTVKLRWTLDASKYTEKLLLYKYIEGVDDDFILYKEFDFQNNPVYEYNDPVEPGQKIRYRLANQTGSNQTPSNPLYDFVYTTYRDPSKMASIRIKELYYSEYDKHLDRNIESRCPLWFEGLPEFEIKVLGVSADNKTTQELATRRLDITARPSGKIETNYDLEIFKWLPSDFNWYEMVTFVIREIDSKKEFQMDASAKFNKKIANALSVDAGASAKISFTKDGDPIGEDYLNYYEHPNKHLHGQYFDFKIVLGDENDVPPEYSDTRKFGSVRDGGNGSTGGGDGSTRGGSSTGDNSTGGRR